MIEHWLETTNPRHEECHGEDYMPKDSPAEYIRWNAGGIEVCPKVSTVQMSLEMQMREEANKEDYSWLDLV